MRNQALRPRDENHGAITEAYKAMYCSVFDTSMVGFGYPDLTVGIAGQTHLVEIKGEDGKLRASQELFIKTWRGAKVVIVRNERDVMDHVKSVRERYENGA